MYGDPCPISAEADQQKEWVEDELTWQDVYAQKPVEYLEAIARGETPVWNSELKKYVYGDDEEMTIGGSSSSSTSEETYEDPQSEQEVDDDLPW